MHLYSYWSRWVTARKLAMYRKKDPAWVETLERLAKIGGMNIQLDSLHG